MARTAIAACLALLLVPASAVPAQEPHHHEAIERLGTVHFPISCNAAAQPLFGRGVAWLHSFEYQEALQSFEQAAAADPRCAMAHWGAAMTQYHPLWAAPTAEEMAHGRREIAAAQSLGAPTPRERDYIAALHAFYDPALADHRARVLAYEAAMARLHARQGDDREATVFYSLALIAAGTLDDDPGFARERQAGRLLNAVLAAEPDHPGVAHYLIHSFDYPALAQLALPAARRYAGIAPDSAHAQHMPSHIFTRLGLWDEAIRANSAAEAAARHFIARHSLPGAWDQQIHAMDYLTYAYLQSARDTEAGRVVEALGRIARVEPVNQTAAYAFTAIPARYALERRNWAEAAALELSPSARAAIPWDRFPWAEAALHFARAVGAARSRNIGLARVETARLQALQASVRVGPGEYDWSRQVDIQRQIAAAWLAWAEGRGDEAARAMQAAATLDDATEKHPVSPGSILPAREQLGDLLLELGRPAEALAAYETALQRAPNRFAGLYGAARSARLAGDAAKAQLYYARLLQVAHGDSRRAEHEEAQAFLSARRASR